MGIFDCFKGRARQSEQTPTPSSDLSRPDGLEHAVLPRTDAQLIVLAGCDGIKTQSVIPLGKDVLLGRKDTCGVVIPVTGVSREHARLSIQPDGSYLLEDLRSVNGTFLNEERLTAPRVLKAGDRIRIERVRLEFSPGKAASSQSQAAQLDGAQIVDDPEAAKGIISRISVLGEGGGLRLSANPERQLRALLAIQQHLRGELDVKSVLSGVMDQLFELFAQADRGTIVFTGENGALIPEVIRHRREDQGDEMRISRTVVNSVLSTGEAVLSRNAARDFAGVQSIQDFGMCSMMCVPLLDRNNKPFGVVQLDSGREAQFLDADLDLLAGVASQVAMALENARLGEVQKRAAVLDKQLEQARDMQRILLPDKRPEIAGYQIFDYYRSAYAVGGDLFDYIPLADGCLAVVLGDVAGKGPQAALMMAKLISDNKYQVMMASEPSAAVAELSNMFATEQWEDHFATFLLFVINTQTHEVTVVNAGHETPLLRRAGGEVERIGENLSGLPLGVVENWEYEECRIKLNPGDCIMANTDGLSDAVNGADERFTPERVVEVVKSLDIKGVEDLGGRLVKAVEKWSGPRWETDRFDDICIIAFGREGA